MTLVNFFVQLAGAVMLLLYAVRMVRTGIERAFGASFRRHVTSTTGPAAATITGIVLAVVLQSSAAVALLAAGFAGNGTLSFAAGLAIILGADLGSALLIQVLSFDLEWLMPALLAIGGGFFIKSDRRGLKQAGRIILGIAFILLSLRLLRETMIPIRESDFLPAVAAYLESDLLTAFIAGAFLAFIMHSSVATVLMCVTIVSIEALPVNAGIALVLGANLGSALIPVWLSRSMNSEARRLPVANLLIRGTGAILTLLVFSRLVLPHWMLAMGDAQALITVHVVFNLLLLLTVPACKAFERPVSVLLPTMQTTEPENPILRSALDDSALNKPPLAIASLRREVLRMAQIVESMITPVMQLYSDFDLPRMNAIRAQDSIVNAALDDIKHYVASIPDDNMSSEQRNQTRELTEYAIALETAGDIVCKQLLTLAQEKADDGVRLSRDGSDELIAMHERALQNLTLAMNLLISNDLESARLLLEEKSEMVHLERTSRKKHLRRLSNGSAVSFDSSNIHLETLQSLNAFNGRVVTLAYPILYRGGQLLETRLIESLDSIDGTRSIDRAD
ncbi:Na/Pi cotransporter [Chromatiales bacterium (ex Bugula neritina AB1)]|nr:Na/Pi cotransporter [Chromatiales bacterium (ex Bugula neritina AB1)]